MNAAAIETILRAALRPQALEVLDDSHLHAGHAGAQEGGHYRVHIIAPCFAGLTRVARHRLVYDSLGSLSAQRVHALAIVATAPGEVAPWRRRAGQKLKSLRCRPQHGILR